MLCLLATACAGTVSKGITSSTRTASATDAERAAAPRFAQALTLMKNREDDAAIAAFLDLHRDFPSFSGPAVNLGILHAQKKDTVTAITYFEKAVRANPRNAVAWSWLGTMRRNAGDHAKARDAYLAAIAARPEFAPAHYNLAVLYDVYLKRPGEALTEYRAYRALTRDHVIVDAWIHELDEMLAPRSVAQGGSP